MRIVDLRERTKAVPAAEALARIAACIPEHQRRGIRRLVLMDHDYHEHHEALARYVEVEGTHAAEIEFYLEDFLDYPESLLYDRFFLTWHLSVILMHEVYHHLVRGLHERRQHEEKLEETEADQWAAAETSRIFEELFPPERYKKELRDARTLLEDMKKGIYFRKKY